MKESADRLEPEVTIRPLIDRNRCEGKGSCVQVCPESVFAIGTSILQRAADGLLRRLGRYPVLVLLAVASTATFAYFLPQQIQKVTLGGSRGGAKLLDEHVLTWTAQDADLLLGGLGAAGRQAYRHFYLSFDFYFPALLSSLTLVSLLAILMRRRPRARYVAFLPVVPYLFDFAENLNHLTMLGAWPEHSSIYWAVGPWFTAGKWISLFGTLGVVAFAALLALLDSRSSRATCPAEP